MEKSEFLRLLQLQLDGQMPEGKAAAHVQYYKNYIESQILSGRREEEVLEELGDPRLIARTLLDVEEQEENAADYAEEDFFGRAVPEEIYEEDPDEYEASDYGYVRRRSYHLDLSSWYGKAIVIIIAALVLAGLVILLGILIPVLLIACLLIWLFARFVRR